MLGEFTTIPRPLPRLRGPTSKGEGRERRKGKGKGEEGSREVEGPPPPLRKFLDPPVDKARSVSLERVQRMEMVRSMHAWVLLVARCTGSAADSENKQRIRARC